MQVNLQIPSKLVRLLEIPKRVKIAVGGRGGGKSIAFCDFQLMFCDAGQRVCSAREFQNTIDDSVHETLKQEISRYCINDSFFVSNTDIKSKAGGRIIYKGLARNVHSIQSIGAIDKLFIEEGQSISHKTLRILTPSIRSGATESDEMPEIWISMNRAGRAGAIAQKYLARAEPTLAKQGWYEDETVLIVELNYNDNPWFPPELELERQDDEKNLSSAEYRHIWLGDYNDEVPNAIIKQEWFNAAIDACKKLNIEPSGAVIAAHDPADTGADSKAIAIRKGIHYQVIDEIDAENGNIGCRLAAEQAIQHSADLFLWDGDGMGALLREQIAAQFKGINCELRMYRGSGEVDNKNSAYKGLSRLGSQDKLKTNKETFYNKRAQAYMMLANKFHNTYRAVIKKEYVNPDELISISSNIKLIDKLRSEVCSITRKMNNAGKIQILSKEEAKRKYELASPGMADCLAMSQDVPALAVNDNITKEFVSLW